MVERVYVKLTVCGGSVNKINVGYAFAEFGKTAVCTNVELAVYGFEQPVAGLNGDDSAVFGEWCVGEDGGDNLQVELCSSLAETERWVHDYKVKVHADI